MRKGQVGITLVELLIAMAVLGTVLALAYGTITSGVRSQRLSEANVTTQAKLRRILEVMSQDIRGTVFGSVSNVPYVNSETAISFSLITGGAGYQVLQQGASSTIDAGPLSLISNTPPILGGQTLLLNGAGNGVIFDVANVAQNASGNYQITMRSCGSLTYTLNTLLYRINTMGYRYDSVQKMLYIKAAGATNEQPLAYDINAFRITYIYINSTTGEFVERSAPVTVGGIPQKSYTVPGSSPVQTVSLRQIKLYISSTQKVVGREIAKSYQTTVDLGYSQALNVKEIRLCS